MRTYSPDVNPPPPVRTRTLSSLLPPPPTCVCTLWMAPWPTSLYPLFSLKDIKPLQQATLVTITLSARAFGR